MTRLTREKILGAEDLSTVVVEVPEWGGEIAVRTMTDSERDAFEASLIVVGGDGKHKVAQHNFRAKLCALCIVDEKGARMFSETDVEALGRKSAAALSRVADAASTLNGIGEKAAEAAKKP